MVYSVPGTLRWIVNGAVDEQERCRVKSESDGMEAIAVGNKVVHGFPIDRDEPQRLESIQ